MLRYQTGETFIRSEMTRLTFQVQLYSIRSKIDRFYSVRLQRPVLAITEGHWTGHVGECGAIEIGG